MPAAELAFLVLLVAGALSRLLDFHLVIGELRRSLRSRGYGCSQKVHPRSSGSCRGVQLRNFILLEAFYWMPHESSHSRFEGRHLQLLHLYLTFCSVSIGPYYF
jgi:hypothetical protein